MKDNKNKNRLKGKSAVTLGLCILSILIAVGSLGIYKKNLERIFTKDSNDLAKNETELTTEEETGDDSLKVDGSRTADNTGRKEEDAEVPPYAAGEELFVESEEAGSNGTEEASLNTDSPEKEAEHTPEEAALEAAGNELAAVNLDFVNEKLSWPVAGDVILDYSPEETIYFSTLKQYRTNNGILIRSEVGDPVLAPADARVERADYDDMLGSYLVLNLGSGYQVICGQLNNICVEQGQILPAGAVMGEVAEPTRFFCVEGPHIFLRMTKDGNNVDPLDFLQ